MNLRGQSLDRVDPRDHITIAEPVDDGTADVIVACTCKFRCTCSGTRAAATVRQDHARGHGSWTWGR